MLKTNRAKDRRLGPNGQRRVTDPDPKLLTNKYMPTVNVEDLTPAPIFSPKPYAALIVGSLRVVRFDSRDELQDALKTLKSQGKTFFAFKYHHGAEGYVQCEVWG